MRNALTRTAIGLAAAAALAGGAAMPAAAAPADPETGLSFYVYKEWKFVANFPQPDTGCHLFPKGADLLVGWSGLENVRAYSTPDCTGQYSSLGTLRSVVPSYVSFSTE
ncbi:hypothetical protein [Lentzea sp. NBRC 102530]|uniref:hypothetical protein n=1 Tax=Lentzea sp. NBRC 102530 TaxID=3032201 RepID=UPI0024A2A233|nr:hypothetical protein [Lentzea sp. NBRC 102530]GLY47990.1 hypothetical protein Lesp01_16460 [Lentzea sp. NBRC 102530]